MTRGIAIERRRIQGRMDGEPEAEPEVEGVVRVKLNEGSWLAEPLNGGKRTRLTYTLLTNPGGLIPRLCRQPVKYGCNSRTFRGGEETLGRKERCSRSSGLY